MRQLRKTGHHYLQGNPNSNYPPKSVVRFWGGATKENQYPLISPKGSMLVSLLVNLRHSICNIRNINKHSVRFSQIVSSNYCLRTNPFYLTIKTAIMNTITNSPLLLEDRSQSADQFEAS